MEERNPAKGNKQGTAGTAGTERLVTKRKMREQLDWQSECGIWKP
jgi:hypothetical protein